MPASSTLPYRGRFAPSPTGRLHLGSLVAAVASFLDARSAQGQWFLRIEDIDPLREEPGASDDIQRTLEKHGLLWNESTRFQSHNHARYEDVLSTLQNHQQSYLCPCSRKYLQENDGHHHPTHCNRSDTHWDSRFAIRFRCPGKTFSWNDRILGERSFRLLPGTDDFILKRKEGFYAYQLAVVIDDYDDQISHIVRGQDLLESTPYQQALLAALNWPEPSYAHVPLVMSAQGQKLSKQNKAPILDNQKAAENLINALQFLSFPIQELASTPHCSEILDWAIRLWPAIKGQLASTGA